MRTSKSMPNFFRGSLTFSQTFGLLGLSVDYHTEGPKGSSDSYVVYDDTNIIQIIPKWD